MIETERGQRIMLMIIMPNVLYVDLNDNADCSISLQTDMGPETHQAKKTWNLKWLDVVKLFSIVQTVQNISHFEIVRYLWL